MIKNMHELEAKRSALLKQLGQVGPLVEGSLAVSHRRCHGASGERYRYLMLCRKDQGRSKILTIPKDLHEQVTAWNAEHKRVKALLKAISGLSEQIIHGYVTAKSAARKQAQLQLLDETEARNA
jgi:hypothetical protein